MRTRDLAWMHPCPYYYAFLIWFELTGLILTRKKMLISEVFSFIYDSF
jgi:hypothetical protein